MSQNAVTRAERSGESRLGRTKDRDNRHSEQRSEMHRAGVICQQQTAFAQLVDQLVEGGLADAIHAGVAQRIGNLLANRHVFRRAEKNPLHGRLRGDRCCDLGEALRQPSFGQAVFRARTEPDLKLRFRRGRNQGRAILNRPGG